MYLNIGKVPGREYRATVADHANMLLREDRPNNRLDESKWKGNGFPGHFQFVPYLGKEPIRPGEKRERDMQQSTLALENAKLLNTTAMGRAQVQFTAMPSERTQQGHDFAMETMRSMRRYGQHHEKAENPHAHQRNELELSMHRQSRIQETQQAMQSLRTAGLAGINPRMGTSGSLPDMTRLRGKEGLNLWRTSTPWAVSDLHTAPAAWPRQDPSIQPN